VIKVLVFNKRKEGTSVRAYREHYENVHVPLALSFYSDLVAVYRRNYIDLERTALAETRTGLTTGSAGFDSVSEVFFESWEAFETFRDRSADPVVREQILADEEKFLDPSAIRRYVVVPDGDSAWS
jgi:hypothetical protein